MLYSIHSKVVTNSTLEYIEYNILRDCLETLTASEENQEVQ